MESLTKKQIIIIGAIGVVILVTTIYYIYSITNTEEGNEEIIVAEESEQKTEEVDTENIEEIIVHIAGEVNNEGIVRINEGARIADVIEKAGGLTLEADITNINLAYVVEDGQKITIPKKQENKEIETITESAEQNATYENETATKKVNINKADIDELQELPGIGESTAQKIINYREENGKFKQIEDIMNVPGIGEAKFENIKENIKVK